MRREVELVKWAKGFVLGVVGIPVRLKKLTDELVCFAPPLDSSGKERMSETEGSSSERVDNVRVHFGVMTIPVPLKKENNVLLGSQIRLPFLISSYLGILEFIFQFVGVPGSYKTLFILSV